MNNYTKWRYCTLLSVTCTSSTSARNWSLLCHYIIIELNYQLPPSAHFHKIKLLYYFDVGAAVLVNYSLAPTKRKSTQDGPLLVKEVLQRLTITVKSWSHFHLAVKYTGSCFSEHGHRFCR